jgi:hypothetical protein
MCLTYLKLQIQDFLELQMPISSKSIEFIELELCKQGHNNQGMLHDVYFNCSQKPMRSCTMNFRLFM